LSGTVFGRCRFCRHDDHADATAAGALKASAL
jgi:hypothetical protein